MSEFRADPEDLKKGASDILACLDPAKGTDFAALGEGAGDSGHLLFDDAFEAFCATWQEALLILGQRAADKADKLKDMAANYEHSDAQAKQQLVHPYGAGR